MKARQTIYYWDGIFDIDNLMTAEYEAVMQRLLNGEYAELNLEKLRGYNVYSIRINKSDRVLFTTVMVKDRPHLMILDIVDNHDYDKSRFLKKGVLREYMDSIDAEVYEQIIEKHFEPTAEFKADLAKQDSECYFVPAKRFGRKYIEFDQDQQTACRAALPLVITGSAGSGKSCAVFQLVVDYATRHLADLTHPVLYVAASDNLCKSMKRQWDSLPIASADTQKLIQFKTYADVIRELDKESLQKMQEVGQDEFILFINASIKKVKKIDKSLSTQFLNDKEALYQECRIICGCDSWEEYEKLGEYQAILKDKTHRQWLYKEYQAYIAYLKGQGKYDLAFYTPTCTKYCELVVVDETPDLSRLQVKVLRNLSVNPESKNTQPQIVYCEDPRQNLYNNINMHTYFGLLLNAKVERVSFINLNTSHRCPVAVTKLADSVTQLGARLSGQRAPAAARIAEQDNAGNVTWLSKITEEDMQTFAEDAQSAHFAVITLPEYKEVAQKLFKTELVFTVEEIKGLEYRKVVVYRLMDTPIFYAANKHLASLENSGGKSERQDQYGPPFNGLYAALTRATESVIIIQDNEDTKHKLQHIDSCLNKKVQQQAPKKVPLVKIEDQRAGWLEEAKNQLSAGNIKKAEEICSNRLAMTAAEFQTFKAKYLGEAAPAPIVVAMSKSQKKRLKKKAAKPLAEEDDPEYYRNILSNTNSIKLQELFNDEKAHIKLFKPLPQFNDECVFTLLCDESGSRNDIFNRFFIDNFSRLVQYMTPTVMLRKNRATPYPPPLYWLITNEYAMGEIAKHPAFDTFFLSICIDNFNILLSARRSEFPIFETSILYWLSASGAGRRVLTLLLEPFRDFFSKFSLDLMFNRYNGKYEVPTSFFDNCFYSEDGLELLIKILELNPRLMQAVTMQHLFYDIFPFDNHWTRMDGLLIDKCKFGKDFIRRLQAGNPGLHENDLTKELPSTIGLTEKYKNSYDFTDCIDALKILDDNFTEETIRFFMKSENAGFLLFKVPYRDNECFFVTAFKDPVKRKVMLDFLYPAYAHTLSHDISASALCGRDPNGIPPLFWMCVNLQHVTDLYCWLFDNQRICASLSKALSFQVSLKQYTQLGDGHNVFKAPNMLATPIVSANTKLSAFLLLALSERGLDLLAYFSNKIQYFDCVNKESLFSVSLVHNGAKVSLFTYLCNSGQRGIRLLSLIMHAPLASCVTSEMLCGDIKALDKSPLPDCPLTNLWKLNSGEGIDLLIHIISHSNHFANSMTARVMMYGLINRLNDNSYLIRMLTAIFNRKNGPNAMRKLLLCNMELAKGFDHNIFGSGCDAKKNPHKAALRKAMEATEEGYHFILDVLNVLSDPSTAFSSSGFFANSKLNNTRTNNKQRKP